MNRFIEASKIITEASEACMKDMNGRADKAGTEVGDVDPNELEMGIKIEMEHTDDKKIAFKIALDHLTEIPNYYSRLKKMEKQAGV